MAYKTALPEQIFESLSGSGIVAIGGNDKEVSDTDTASGAGIGDTNIEIIISGSDIEDIDFGFSYDVITNANDSGEGSLRQFIANANAITGSNTSLFELDSGVQSVSLQTALPDIADTTGETVINGYTQNGTSENSLINGNIDATLLFELNGAAIVTDDILTITSESNTVQGLVLQSGSDAAIVIDGATASGNTISGNFIGTNAAGSSDFGNSGAGIEIINGAEFNIVGGSNASERNLVSGNTGDGIVVESNNNTIAGNSIGVQASASFSLGNDGRGIVISGDNNTIGGTTNTNPASACVGDCNLVSAGGDSGMVFTASAENNTVQGNFVGLNHVGTIAKANAGHGLELDGENNIIGSTSANGRNIFSGNDNSGILLSGTGHSIIGNFIGTRILGLQDIGNTQNGIEFNVGGANNITIGGGTAGEGNIISGNDQNGILVSTGSTLVTIQGNTIGLRETGISDLGNSQNGIFIAGATSITVGSDGDATNDATEGNTISGNDASGIEISNSSSVIIAGNLIGTEDDGETARGNTLHGIYLNNGSNANRIGSDNSDTNESNTIAFNGGDGVFVEDSTTINNTISFNSIHDNTELGIDLAINGVTANDAGDTDVGPNRLVNFPVINDAEIIGDNLEVEGTLDLDTTETNATIEIYKSDNDATGNGEGEIFIGSLAGSTSWSASFTTNDISLGDELTALVTDENGNTSEFSSQALVEEGGVAIRGQIFEDTNYLGGNGTAFEEGIDVGFENVTVEAYSSTGQLLDQEVTSSTGTYTLNVTQTGALTIRVVSESIGDIDTNPSSGRNGVLLALPEQTFESDGTTSNGGAGALGGNSKTIADTAVAAGAGTGDTNIALNLGNTDVLGVDFGFSYNLIVNTLNSGQGSLDQYLANANAVTGANTSFFEIDGAGPHTITPTTELTTISDGTTILNGFTQNGATVNTEATGGLDTTLVVELNGSSLPGGSDILQTTATGTIFRGLAIHSGPQFGILFDGDSADLGSVEGSYIGTNLAGTTDLGNTSNGIQINGADNITIGGSSADTRNVISGNANGIHITTNSADTTIEGNIIGLNESGTSSIANVNGIQIGDNSASVVTNVTIGGSTTSQRNIISGNSGVGIDIEGTNTTGVSIQGNFIGTDIVSTTGIGGQTSGIGIEGVTGVVLIGGANAGEENIISGNTVGITLNDAENIDIQGNHIGLDSTGSVDVGNASDGIQITGSSQNNTIGTDGDGSNDATEGNIISGNGGDGIDLNNAATTTIAGNTIGAAVNGTSNIGNDEHGINLNNGSFGNIIGTQNADGNEQNIIAFNGFDGVALIDATNRPKPNK